MNKMYIIFVILFSINIYASSLEERLIDPQTQKEAIKELWDRGEAAIPELNKMLKNENKGIREIAIVRLGELKNKEVIPDLIELLNQEPELELRVRIIQFFIKLKSLEVIEILQKRAVTAVTPEDRMAAIIGIGNIVDFTSELKNTEVIKTLKTALNDNAGIVRMRAAYFLAKLDNDSGYETAIRDIKNENAIVREYAVEALGEMHMQGILDITKQQNIENLINITLEDKETWVRIKSKIAKEKLNMTQVASSQSPVKKRMSHKAMLADKPMVNQKIAKLKEILNSDKILEVKIWAANELLNMGEEGKKAAEEIIENKGAGTYVMRKEMSGKKRME